MHIEDIVTFWRGQQEVDDQGQWGHRLDRKVLDAGPHTFNLDYPVSPYVGHVLTAPVIILGANAKYDPAITPSEFSDEAAIKAYVARIDDPSHADWSFVSRYYDDTNYGHLIGPGKVVVVNACTYRSPRLSQEKENQRMIPRLPSSIFIRRWLLDAVFPLAKQGDRLIINNRGQHWRLGPAATATGVVRDPCPASPLITSNAFSAMNDFLANRP
ncbi:hypothetical protein ACFB49_32560 [Sphingomonas sp. DBB INV C78]|uniref:hypothetical protein n=1 Tax=Sphingomonas sp. DBB INV C78 TaxID=3349434 RepID=UPI0036D34B13